MESYNNAAKLNVAEESEHQNHNPETLKAGHLASERTQSQNSMQMQERKTKRPRIQRPVYSAKLA